MPLIPETTDTSERPTPRFLTFLRSVLRVAVFAVAGLVLALLVTVFLLQLPFVAGPVAQMALSLANPWEGTEVSVSAAGGTWLTDLSLREVRISSPDGSLVIAIDSLGASYDLAALARGELRFNSVRLVRPIVVTGTTPEGDLEFLHPFRSGPEADSESETEGRQELEPDTSEGLRISFGSVAVSLGGFFLHAGGDSGGTALDVSDILIAARDFSIGRSISVTLDTLSASYRPGPDARESVQVALAGAMADDLITVRTFDARSPRTNLRASGTLALPLDTAFTAHESSFRLDADPIAYSDIHPFVDAFGPEGVASVQATLVRGPHRAHVTAVGSFTGGGTFTGTGAFSDRGALTVGGTSRGGGARTGGGSFQLTATAEAHEPGKPDVRADLKTFDVSIASITGSPDTTERITAHIRLAGQGSSPESFTGTVRADLNARGLVAQFPLLAAVEASLVNGAADLRGSGTLDALRFDLRGRINAYADPPTYDLTAATRIPSVLSGRRSDDVFHRLRGLDATVHASGTGFDPLAGTGSGTVRAEWTGNPALRTLLVDVASADSTAEARALLTTPEGSMRLDAQAQFGAAEGIVLRALEFSTLDLAEILGAHATVSLTGTASGYLRGMDPATMDGKLTLRLDSSRVGTTRIGRGTLDASAENGKIVAKILGETSDGNIALQALAEPFARQPSLAVQEARFEHLDLGGVLLDDDGMTDLNGTASAQLTRTESSQPPGLTGFIQVDLGPSRINSQNIASAEVVAELTGQTAAVGLDLRTPQGGALISGSVEPFQEFPDVRLADGRFEHLDIGALAGIDSLSTDLSGTLAADVQGTSWESASGSATLTLLTSRINREPIREAQVMAFLTGGDASLRGSATLGSGTLSVLASGAYRDDRATFDADASINLHDLSRLTRDSSLSTSGVHASLAAEGVWGAPEVTRFSSRIAVDGRLDSLRVDSLVSVLAVAGRTIRVDNLLVRSNAGVIRGAGTIAAFDTTGRTSSDFTLSASLHSLHRLRGILGIDFSPSGTVQLNAGLAGNGRAGRLDVSSAIANLGVEDILIPAFAVRGSAHLGPGPAVDTLVVQAGGGDLAIGDLVFDSVAASGKTEGARSIFSSSILLESGEKLSCSGTVDQLKDRYGITLDSFTFTMSEREWRLERPARIEAGDGLFVDDLTLLSGTRRISARGTLDPHGQQDFTLQIDSVAFDRFARMLGRPRLGGDLSFSGLVTGPARDARATGRLTAQILSAGEPIGTLESDLEWAGGLAKVTGIVTQADQSRLKATISLPLDLPVVSDAAAGTAPPHGPPIAGREFALHTDGFDLKFLEPFLGSDAVTGFRGLLTADLSLRGQGGSLSGTGRIGIDTGQVQANSIGVTYSDIHLRGSLEGLNLEIDTLSVRTGQGGMGTSGTVSLASPEDPALDLLFTLNKFVGINTQRARAVVDGTVRAGGTLKQPVVTGDITVDEANFVVPETVGEGQVEQVQLTDADYEVLRERFGYRRPGKRTSEGSDSLNVSLDVALHFPRRSWIRKKSNPSLSVEIEGNLNVRSGHGEPLSLAGVLKPVPGRSYVSQFGRQFEIKSGEIRFDGPPELFNMNVDSEYKVPARSGSGMSEATIRMRVERKLERFEFNLSSDPPMEQADILSYLTTGTASTGAFASTSSQGNIATSAALEQVVGAIGGLTEDKIPLDIFQIRQDGARGITIVAGNYVSPQTYLGVRYPILLQQTGQDSYYDTGTEFEVEYQSFPWLFWNAKGGSTRLMLLMKSRYAY